MATRSEELTAQALLLAKQLGKEGTTTVDGLDESQLGKLVDGLQAEADAAKVAAANANKKGGKPATYTVNAGYALTSKRGIIGEGKEITPDDVSGGAEALDAFVESGHLSKK